MVCIKVTDFYMLILYPDTLTKVFIDSEVFVMVSIESIKYRMSSSNRNSLIPSSFSLLDLSLVLLLL